MYRNSDYLKEEYITKGKSLSVLAKEHNISPKLMFYYTKKFGLVGQKSRIKNTVNINKFDIKDPIFYYYAGLIATDGFIDDKNGRVILQVSNEGSYEVLCRLKDYFEYSGEVNNYSGKFNLCITSRKLIEILGQLNISGAKGTSTIRYPKHFYSKECEIMFLRGVLDGDGNIHTHTSKHTGKIVGGAFRISSSCTDLIEGVISSVNNLLGTSYEKKYSSNSSKVKYPQLEMRVQDSKDLYKILYQGYDEYKFLDKYNKYKQIS